jgi:hypothetical protein
MGPPCRQAVHQFHSWGVTLHGCEQCCRTFQKYMSLPSSGLRYVRWLIFCMCVYIDRLVFWKSSFGRRVGVGAVPGPIRIGKWNSYITGLSKGHIVPWKKKNMESDVLSGHPSMCLPGIVLLSIYAVDWGQVRVTRRKKKHEGYILQRKWA